MDLIIKNKGEFITKFIKPICNIADSGIVKIQENKASCILSTQDASVILYAQFNLEIDSKVPVVLNCPDLRRFERILSILDSDSVTLKYLNNCLNYNDSKTRFKYHLLEGGIINGPTLNVDKIAKLEFPIVFNITQQKINELIKGSTFANNASKLYISFTDNKVYGEIADRTNTLIDTFTTVINEDCPIAVSQSAPDVPVLFETIKIIAGVKFDTVKVNINPKLGVVLFEIAEADYKLKYIVSALVT